MAGPRDGNDMMGSTDFNRGVYLLQTMAPPCDTAKTAPCIPTPGGVLPANVEVAPNGRIFNYPGTNLGPRAGLAYRAGG